MKTIARTAKNKIAAIRETHTAVTRYDETTGNIVPSTSAEAFEALLNRPSARLVQLDNGDVRVTVHSNSWYTLTIPAPAAEETVPAPAPAPAPAAAPADRTPRDQFIAAALTVFGSPAKHGVISGTVNGHATTISHTPNGKRHIMTVSIEGEWIESDPFNVANVMDVRKAIGVLWDKIQRTATPAPALSATDDEARTATVTEAALLDQEQQGADFARRVIAASAAHTVPGNSALAVSLPDDRGQLTVTVGDDGRHTAIVVKDGHTYTSAPYTPGGYPTTTAILRDLYDRVTTGQHDPQQSAPETEEDPEPTAEERLRIRAFLDASDPVADKIAQLDEVKAQEKATARKRRAFISTAAALTEALVLKGGTELTGTAPAGHSITVTRKVGTGYRLSAVVDCRTYTSKPYSLTGSTSAASIAGDLFDRITTRASDQSIEEQRAEGSGVKSNLWSVTDTDGREIALSRGADYYDARVDALTHPHVRDADHAGGIELRRLTTAEADTAAAPSPRARFIETARTAVGWVTADQQPTTEEVDGYQITAAVHALSDTNYVLIVRTPQQRMLTSDGFPSDDAPAVAAHLYDAITAPSTREEFAAPFGPFDPAEAAARVERRRSVFIAEAVRVFSEAYRRGLPVHATAGGYSLSVKRSHIEGTPYLMVATIASTPIESEAFAVDAAPHAANALWAKIRAAIETPSSATHAAARRAAGRQH